MVENFTKKQHDESINQIAVMSLIFKIKIFFIISFNPQYFFKDWRIIDDCKDD